MVRERDWDTKSSDSRSGFDPELRFSFYLIQILPVKGQNFLRALKMAAIVYESDHCCGGLFNAWVTTAI